MGRNDTDKLHQQISNYRFVIEVYLNCLSLNALF